MTFIKKHKKLLFTTLTLAGCLTVSSAQAGITTTFTDRTAWEAAVGAGNFVTEGFNVASDRQLANSTVEDVGEFNVFYTTLNGVDDLVNREINILGSFAGGLGQDDYLQLEWDPSGTDRTTALELRFDSPVNAFAANFIYVDNFDDLSLTLDGTTVNLYDDMGGSGLITGLNTSGFLGWTLDNAVSSAAFSGNGFDRFVLDNVSLGNVSAVPVPAAVWLMGSALIGLFGFGRKKA